MREVVLKPKCPNCGKKMAEWVREAGFRCPRCDTSFTIGVVEETSNEGKNLTTISNYGSVTSRVP